MKGYDLLASEIAINPDDLAIFRRFISLNVLNTLSMQSELVRLEELAGITAETCANSDDPIWQQYQYSLAAVDSTSEGGESCELGRLRLEISRLLPKYSMSTFFHVPSLGCIAANWWVLDEALIQLQTLFNMAPVDKARLPAFRERLEEPIGRGISWLTGHEGTTWESEHEADLTSLTGRHRDKSGLSKMIEKFVTTTWHKHITTKAIRASSTNPDLERDAPPLTQHYYSDDATTKWVNALSSILASMLPGLSALLLFFVQDALARMIAIVVFTFLFSTTLTFVASANRAECFLGTSAFAAVLVVFVGGTDGIAACSGACSVTTP